MPFFTPRFLAVRLTGMWLAGLTLSSAAQTAPPTWQGASNIGPETLNKGIGAVDAAGNHFVLGFVRGTTNVGGTVLTSVGDVDAYLAKYSPAGTVLWVRQIGSPNSDLAFDVALDAAGNSYVTGRVGGSVSLGNNVSITASSALSTAFVVRYSPQGTPQWAQQSNTSNSSSTGFGLGTDAAGDVYLTGSCDSPFTLGSATVSVPAGQRNPVFLARLSGGTGTVQSLVVALSYPVVNSGSYGLPRLAVGPTGDAFLTIGFMQPTPVFPDGSSFTNRGGSDVLVAKYTAQGTFAWAQQIGSLANDLINDAAVDAAGNVYVCGSAGGINTLGSVSLPYQGGTEGYLAKYSPQGALQWAQSLVGPADEAWNSVGLDATGAPYVAGSYGSAAQLGTATLSNAGSTDVVVAAYTPMGQLRWTQQAGSPGADAGYYIGLDAGNAPSVRGLFANNCTFSTVALTTALPGESFLARLGSTVSAVQPRRSQLLGCYPNPARATVLVPGLPAGARVQLLDALGRMARETTVSAAAEVSVRGLTPGLYTLRATDARGQQLSARLAVE